MMSVWVFCTVLFCVLVTVLGAGDIGPGVWDVKYIQKCDEDAHKFKFDIVKKKINRTHDGFNADLMLDEEFTDKYGIRVELCKHVDGGCKPYQLLTDNCMVNFVNKYAKENVIKCLELAGADPPEFPLPKGNYHIEDYAFDYCELPTDSAYGTFGAKAFILEGATEVGCVELHVEFKVDEDEDMCERVTTIKVDEDEEMCEK